MNSFEDFIQTLKRFERQLFSLVISSFFFSSISTIAEYRHFDAGFMALTSLVAGMMGIAGVLSQYLGSLGNVRRKTDDLLLFEPEKSASDVRQDVFSGVLLLGAFYYLAVNGYQICLLPISIASFLFFRALATSMLAIQHAAEQQKTWHAMTEEERDGWNTRQRERLQGEFERDRIQAELQELLENTSRDLEESRRRRNESERAIRDLRRAQRRIRRQYFVRRVHWYSINLRRKLAGNRLLSMSERMQVEEISKRLETRREELARKAYKSIKEGQAVRVPIEGSELAIYRPKGFGWQCLLIDRSIGEQEAQAMVRDLGVVRDEKSGRFPVVAIFLEPGAELTHQARKLLEGEGLKLYWM